MVKLEVNGITIEVRTVAQAVQFCRSWNGTPKPPAEPAVEATFFRSRNRADQCKSKPPYQVSDREVLAFLDAVTQLPPEKRTATNLAGLRHPESASRHLRGVAQRLVELGLDPSSVVVESRRYGPRTLDPGPNFDDALQVVQERVSRGEAS